MPTDGPLTEAQAVALRAVLDAPNYANLTDDEASDALNVSPLVDGVHQPTAFSQIAGLGDAEIVVEVPIPAALPMPEATPEGETPRPPSKAPTHHVYTGQCLPIFVAQARALASS